jgi:hypothetical protein
MIGLLLSEIFFVPLHNIKCGVLNHKINNLIDYLSMEELETSSNNLFFSFYKIILLQSKHIQLIFVFKPQ